MGQTVAVSADGSLSVVPLVVQLLVPLLSDQFVHPTVLIAAAPSEGDRLHPACQKLPLLTANGRAAGAKLCYDLETFCQHIFEPDTIFFLFILRHYFSLRGPCSFSTSAQIRLCQTCTCLFSLRTQEVFFSTL